MTICPGGKCRFAVLLAALAAGPAVAQERVKIEAVKIGLPPGPYVQLRDDAGQAAHLAKNNTWAPVYVTLRLEREVKRPAALVVQAKDADDLSYTLTVPLPDLTSRLPGEIIQPAELPFMPYVRPNGRGDEVTVTVAYPDSGDPAYWSALGNPFRSRYMTTRDSSQYVVLGLGTKLTGFDLPSQAPKGDNAGNQGNEAKQFRGGRVELASITDVSLMPDQWFGYEAADLVVLTTGDTDTQFVNGLFADPNRKTKRDALLEWVRCGGKLVVSVGSNAPLVGQYEPLRALLPLDVNLKSAVIPVKEVNLDWFAGGSLRRIGVMQPRAGTFPVANLVPKAGSGFRQLVPAGEKAEGPRLVAQAAFGLGRVTVVGFDLDRSPFTDFADKAAFWDVLLKEAGAAKAAAASGKPQNNFNYAANTQSDTEDGLAANIRNHIDTFEGVPVISFGWVAVFIVLYTLLIGPVEYFVLKKVFKRLELTWITFPLIVLTVSAIAYFTAYSLKGNDLKVNKMDVVDVDPASGRVYGRSWFTVFSPRIESYTVSVTPADGWAGKGQPQPAPLVDWLGGSRGGKSSFFSRRYRYHADSADGTLADGLVGVPIQVWSTKAFSAEWSARFDPAAPPVTATLTHPPADRSKVTGAFTLNLPLAEIKDVRLIYAGKAYKHDTPITPGTTVTVFLDRDKEDPDWMNAMGYQASAQKPGTGQAAVTTMSLSTALFHEAGSAGTDAAQLQNATLRRLDQSWRLTADNRNELIVVGRVAPTSGPAEQLMTEANSASPTVLWLKGLPGDGQRQPTPGTLQQETFVRVFVPVTPSK